MMVTTKKANNLTQLCWLLPLYISKFSFTVLSLPPFAPLQSIVRLIEREEKRRERRVRMGQKT